MTALFLLLLLQSAPAGPQLQAEYDRCIDQAVDDPLAGVATATSWSLAGGGYLARQCLGLAYAAQQRWAAAGEAFEEAARAAERVREPRTANYWAQAGNAWLAAGNVTRARGALDAALAAGTLTGQALGEAHLDRARILAAAGDATGARGDLDLALRHAPADPLAWLLSATLARRGGDLNRAATDIAEAMKRAPDDASVQLEAGNIAALRGDQSGAIAAWQSAARLGGDGAVATAARAALAQFN